VDCYINANYLDLVDSFTQVLPCPHCFYVYCISGGIAEDFCRGHGPIISPFNLLFWLLKNSYGYRKMKVDHCKLKQRVQVVAILAVAIPEAVSLSEYISITAGEAGQ
jgi:hypothetical protein